MDSYYKKIRFIAVLALSVFLVGTNFAYAQEEGTKKGSKSKMYFALSGGLTMPVEASGNVPESISG